MDGAAPNIKTGNSVLPTQIRGLVVWLMIIVAETFNGAVRELFLVPQFGSATAKRISFGIALVVIMSLAVIFTKWIGAADMYQRLLVGALWAVLTFSFEAALGMGVFGLSWDQILADYDITRGGLMASGLIFMLFAPHLAAKLREDHDDPVASG